MIIRNVNKMNLNDQIEACNACNFRDSCKKPLIPISVWHDIELMVVAEKPSLEEETTETAYFDRHNYYLKKLLTPFFPLERIHFTYLIKCYNKDLVGKKNSRTCFETFLLKEVDIVAPKMILSMGAVPNKIIGKGKFHEIKRIGFTEKLVHVGFWESSSYLFNSGKTHNERFTAFLIELKRKCGEINNV